MKIRIDLTAKSTQIPDDSLPDFAGSDDAHCKIMQFSSRKKSLKALIEYVQENIADPSRQGKNTVTTGTPTSIENPIYSPLSSLIRITNAGIGG